MSKMNNGSSTNQLIEKLSRDLKPVKRLSSNLRRFAIWGVITLILSLIFFVAMKNQFSLLQRIKNPIDAIQFVTLTAIFILAGIVAVQLSVPGTNFKKWVSITSVVLAAISVVTFFISVDFESLSFREHFSIKCYLQALLASLLCSLLLFRIVLKGTPINPLRTSIFISAAGVSVGTMIALAVCPDGHADHDFLSHFLPMIPTLIGFSLIGWALISRKNVIRKS